MIFTPVCAAVCIATRYGLDGPEIESRWGESRFSAPVHTGPWDPPNLYTVGTGTFLGSKSAGGVALTTHTPSSAEVKERVELYLYSTCGPCVACYRVTLKFMRI
jgi:hypothetical protein